MALVAAIWRPTAIIGMIERGFFACGFNPEGKADETLVVTASPMPRTSCSQSSSTTAATHHIGLGSTLISPDYVGAIREVVEATTGATCIFALGACGELSPRQVHQGSTEVADNNGRNLGYASRSPRLATMDPRPTIFNMADQSSPVRR